MDKLKDGFLWLDFETTGLDPHSDQLLEVGVIVSSTDLSERERYTAVIKPERPMTLSLEVAEMHARGNLLQQLKDYGQPLATVETLIVDLVKKHFLPGARPRLAGASIHFDRGFLKVHMPAIEPLLHYRMLDISTLIHAYNLWAGRPQIPAGKKVHRAIDDIDESFRFAQHMKHFLSVAGPAVDLNHTAAWNGYRELPEEAAKFDKPTPVSG